MIGELPGSKRGVLALIGACCAISGQALAFEAEAGFEVVSDYRWRGISMSHERGAATFSESAAFQNGIWVASSLGSLSEDYGGEELSASAGYSARFAEIDWSMGVAAYAYPGADDIDYQQGLLSAERTLGAFKLAAGFEYAPKQDNLDGSDSYGWLRGEWAAGEHLAFHAQWGVNDGAMAIAKRAEDIDVGAAFMLGPAMFSARYVDAETIQSAVVFGISVARAP